MAPHTLYMTSHTWQHKRYICHLIHYIWHYIHCMCVIKPSVSIIPHPLSGWHHTHSMYDIIISMHDITCTLYDITPLCVCHHTQYIYDIISNIYDITHTAFMTTLHLYLTSHPQNSTPQPLYLCHHKDDRHICLDVSLYQWHHNKYGSHNPWHTYDIMHTLHDITFTLYDINDQFLWHHNHCNHDIRSLYDITSMVYDISSPIPVTSQPLYL